MFGRRVDAVVLDLLTHDRNLTTEEQTKARRRELASNQDRRLCEEYARKFLHVAGPDFEWREKRVLDVACGIGDLANYLAMNGAGSVTGIDVDDTQIAVAAAFAERKGIKNVRFISDDFLSWETSDRYDYVISYEALEHIPDVERTLKKMASLIDDGGRIINIAAGFWRAPLGADHCDGVMRVQIPWRQLIFNDEALFDVRRRKFRPTDPGLNRYTLSDYRKAIRDAQLEVIAWKTNYQLEYRAKGLLEPLSRLLVRLPVAGEYFVFSSLAVLAKS